jgi:hypothetical protein
MAGINEIPKNVSFTGTVFAKFSGGISNNTILLITPEDSDKTETVLINNGDCPIPKSDMIVIQLGILTHAICSDCKNKTTCTQRSIRNSFKIGN